MKKFLLLALIGFMIGQNAKSQTTYTSVNSSTTVTVTSAGTWSTTPTWNMTSGTGSAPITYVISPLYTILVNGSVDLISQGNVTLNVQGKLGFYVGNNDLKLASTATISIAAGGIIGYDDGSPGQTCCNGNNSNNIMIGSGGGSTNMSGPFYFTGPQTAVTGGVGFTTSTNWKTNAGSDDWNDANNWSNGIPSATKTAFITNATTFDPIISAGANGSTLNLFVLTGGILTINSTFGLTVNGDLDNAGTITVKSGGSLVQTATSALVNTGTFNIEQTTVGGVTYLSSPINTIGVNGFGVPKTGANNGQVITDPTNPCNSFSIAPTSPYGNLMEMRENATVNPAHNCSQELWFVKSSGTLENARGYSYANAAGLVTFTGTVNNGSISYANLTRTGAGFLNQADGTNTTTRGWHLVGNPYPSPILITAATLTVMGFDAQIALYNHNGTYTGTWTSIPSGGFPVTIAVGQGFQIRNSTPATTPTFTLNNTFRVVGNPAFHKVMGQNDFLQISLNNGIKTDTTNIFFTAGATDNFDPAFDASRMIDAIQHPMIYSIVNNEQLSYNCLPVMNPNENKAVNISVRTYVAGAHTLTFVGVNSLTSTLTLEDVKLNTFTPIAEGDVYNFTTVTGDNKERFILHFSTDATGIHVLNNSNVKLYPNPALGSTTLMFPKNHNYQNAVITDAVGKTIQEFKISANETTKTLDLKAFDSGIYFIKLNGDSDSSVLKLIKK